MTAYTVLKGCHLEHRGILVSLGSIFLHIAHQLDLPLMPVIFPTQLILRADWLDDEMWLINPLNGETLNEHQFGSVDQR